MERQEVVNRNPRKKSVSKVSRGAIIKAIPGSQGIIREIAKKCGYGYSTLWNWLNQPINDDIREMMAVERESFVDLAETELVKKVKKGSDWAVKYTLSTLGKKRGFTERTDVNIDHKQEITLSFDIPYSKDDKVIDVNPKREISDGKKEVKHKDKAN